MCAVPGGGGRQAGVHHGSAGGAGLHAGGVLQGAAHQQTVLVQQAPPAAGSHALQHLSGEMGLHLTHPTYALAYSPLAQFNLFFVFFCFFSILFLILSLSIFFQT